MARRATPPADHSASACRAARFLRTKHLHPRPRRSSWCDPPRACQFCKRQPAACEVGGQAATAIGHRAQAGARKLYQMITDKRAADHTSSIGGVEDANASFAGTAPHDTLTPNDLQAEWRGVP